MIEAIKGLRGQEQALCKCDDCAAQAVVNAAHGDTRGFARTSAGRNGRPVVSIKNEGQVIAKLQSDGWAYVKGVLRCPKCEEKRKAKGAWFDARAALAEIQKEAEVMAQNVTTLREPTPKQIRLIILALEDAYDDAAKRYRGTHTDKSIAQDIGDGIMPGWVAQQREKLFGPAGNEELANIKAEIEAVKADFAARLAALEKRIGACVESHDKRVSA